MRLERADSTKDKGWYAGSWNSDLVISVGYANEGINEPHVHTKITEIYMIARGQSEIRVEQKTIRLEAGDMIVIEPGEAHTFLSSSDEYFHFVVHVPSLSAKEVKAEKLAIDLSRLGL